MARCDLQLCVFSAKGASAGCPCYAGETTSMPPCTSGSATCVAASDASSRWECDPPDCAPGQVDCATATSWRGCLPLRAWDAPAPCPGDQICRAGACGPPECSPEGARRCRPGDSRQPQRCVNGTWQDAAACGSSEACCAEVGECRECDSGERRCGAANVWVQACAGCAWQPPERCEAPSYCSSGTCGPPPACPPGQSFCPRASACLATCDLSRCQVRSSDLSGCASYCPPSKTCTGGGACCSGNQCSQPLLMDWCRDEPTTTGCSEGARRCVCLAD